MTKIESKFRGELSFLSNMHLIQVMAGTTTSGVITSVKDALISRNATCSASC